MYAEDGVKSGEFIPQRPKQGYDLQARRKSDTFQICHASPMQRMEEIEHCC